MTDIWGKKPKSILAGTWHSGEDGDKIYESREMDAWLEKVRAEYEKLSLDSAILDYWNVEIEGKKLNVREIIKWKETAEKYKIIKNVLEIGADEGYQLPTTRLALIESDEKLEAIKKVINDSSLWIEDRESKIIKILEDNS